MTTKKTPAKKRPRKKGVTKKGERVGRAAPVRKDKTPRPKRKLSANNAPSAKKASEAFMAYREARHEERKSAGLTVGRPTSYIPECALVAHAMARMGATPQEMAIEMGVNPSTLYAWMLDEPEFSKAVEAGKAAYDERVEVKLYERAVGYTYEAEELFAYQGEITRAQTIKHVPPDVGAIQFWLTNRKPEKWKQIKHQVEYPMGTKPEHTMSDEDLERIAKGEK